VSALAGLSETESAAPKEGDFDNLLGSRLPPGRAQYVGMGLFGRRKPSSSSVPAATDVTSVEDTEIPRYPPFLKGLLVAASARILATQRELIARLQDALAFTDARFATLVRPVVERYAAFVHLLPASEA